MAKPLFPPLSLGGALGWFAFVGGLTLFGALLQPIGDQLVDSLRKEA